MSLDQNNSTSRAVKSKPGSKVFDKLQFGARAPPTNKFSF